jgi:hypothetical protein
VADRQSAKVLFQNIPVGQILCNISMNYDFVNLESAV